VLIDTKLKERIKQESYKYDFKYMQKQFDEPVSLKYKSYEELYNEIRHLRKEGSANALLNLWQKNRFAFETVTEEVKSDEGV